MDFSLGMDFSVGMDFVPARDLRTRVADGFWASYGAEPVRLGRAPGRVNLIGEHTDYNAGLCLPIALAHSTWVAVTPRVDGRVRVTSAQTGYWTGSWTDSWTGAAADGVGWASYVTATLRELGVAGADVYVDSDVPVGSGLSSSAALICALCVALGETNVVTAIRAETEGVGAPTGGLDQTISTLGSPGEALLLDFSSSTRRSNRRQPVPWSPEAAGLSLLVIDTRVAHAHDSGDYAVRRRECEEAAAVLGVRTLRQAIGLEIANPRARHVTSEIGRVERVVDALGRGDWQEVGRLFTESHVSLRDDFEVSCRELDLVVEEALAQGALGARMTGGGFGGSAIALVPTADLYLVGARIVARFSAEGLIAPHFLLATASSGAERIR